MKNLTIWEISGVPEIRVKLVNLKFSNGNWGNFLHFWNEYWKLNNFYRNQAQCYRNSITSATLSVGN